MSDADAIEGMYGVDLAPEIATQVADPSSIVGSALRAAFGSSLLGARRTLPHLSQIDAIMATPPTIGASSATSSITSGVYIPSVSGSGSYATALLDRIAYRGGGGIVPVSVDYPGNQYVKGTSLTSTASGSAPFCTDIMTDAPVVEFRYNGGGDKIRIRVDGQLVSATPITLVNDGSFYFLPITFATRAFRRISIEQGSSSKFSGFQIGPSDTIELPAMRGPRCIVVGDSFTEGTGATAGAASDWVRRFGEAMGWDDVWASGVGGTGYLNPGTAGRVKFRDRLANDVIPFAPQIVMWAGGLNDQGTYTAANIQAEALACYQAIQAGIPGVVQVVLSPFWPAGVETYPTSLLDTRDAIKAAAAAASTTAQPVYFVDLIEMPVGATPVTTTLAAASSASATSLSSTAFIPTGATIEVDTGTLRERRVITNVTGVGPYTLSVKAMTGAHASGVAVRQVGPGYMTGSGQVGTTTGNGNADILRSSDGTHPTQAGHEHIGNLVRSLIARQLLQP